MSVVDLRGIMDARAASVSEGVTDPDELSERIAATGFRPMSVVPMHRGVVLDARLQAVPAGSAISFVRMTLGAETFVQFDRADEDHLVFAMNLSGTARFRYRGAEVGAGAGEVGFIPPFEEFTTRVSADFDQVFTAIRRSRLERVASLLLDTRDPGPIEFDYFGDITAFDADVAYLMSAVMMTSGSASEIVTGRLVRRLEDVAIEAALMRMSSFRARIPRNGPAHSRSVRTAMEFMMSNLSEPLTLGHVATKAMVSPRALQLAFMKETGESPMRWLRSRRLEQARRLLDGSAHPPVPVTEAAFSVGFLHLGYFSRRYAEQFGEAPSSTRRRALADRAQSR